MDSRVLLKGRLGLAVDATLRKPALHRLKLGSWIAAVLLSLGLWAAAIWAAVAVFAGGT
jgi:hypothetical protein